MKTLRFKDDAQARFWAFVTGSRYEMGSDEFNVRENDDDRQAIAEEKVKANTEKLRLMLREELRPLDGSDDDFQS